MMRPERRAPAAGCGLQRSCYRLEAAFLLNPVGLSTAATLVQIATTLKVWSALSKLSTKACHWLGTVLPSVDSGMDSFISSPPLLVSTPPAVATVPAGHVAVPEVSLGLLHGRVGPQAGAVMSGVIA